MDWSCGLSFATLVTAWLVTMLPITACAQSPAGTQPAAPTAALVTMGPGNELYERFSHNALRIQEPSLRPPYNDVAFNYGIFSFGENFVTDFLPGFIQGRMKYWVAPEATPDMFDAYRQMDRSIALQELNLTPQQAQQLADFLWENARPENRYYVYNYYDDNCSTRIRDAIDRAVGGQVAMQTRGIPTGRTYRFHTRRVLATNPVVFVCLEFVLGQNIDREITRWDEMFLPAYVQSYLRDVTITRSDGSTVPLVRSEQTLFTSARPPIPETPPRVLPYFALAGILIALGLLALHRLSHRRLARFTMAAGITLWLALNALAGCFVTFTNLFTDHWSTYRNENLLQMPPFALLALILLPWALRCLADPAGTPRYPRALRLAQFLAIAALLCSLIGLALKVLPTFYQDNWNIIVWVLPVHAAVAMILLVRRPKPVRHAGMQTTREHQP